MNWREINWLMFGAGAALLIGFTVPWVRIVVDGEAQYLAGFDIAGRGGAYFLVYLLPVMAIAMGATAVKAPNIAAMLGSITGATLVGWAIFEVARFLYMQTSWGLWLSVGGALTSIVGGAFTWRRAHTAVAQAKAAAKAAREAAASVKKKADEDEHEKPREAGE